VAWAELAAYDFISVGKSSGNRLLMDQALAGVAGRPQSIYETQHVTTQLGLVEAGLGIAAVPAMAMPAADHPLLVSVPLVDPVVSRKGADTPQWPGAVPSGDAVWLSDGDEANGRQRAGYRARRPRRPLELDAPASLTTSKPASGRSPCRPVERIAGGQHRRPCPSWQPRRSKRPAGAAAPARSTRCPAPQNTTGAIIILTSLTKLSPSGLERHQARSARR
jgi:hypothetical protein